MKAQTQLEGEKEAFYQTAFDYVVKLQEVNEKKKFEFVETVSFFLDIFSAIFLFTVLLKGKLTASTRFSKLNSCVAKVKTFQFRDARIESRGSRVEKWGVLELIKK